MLTDIFRLQQTGKRITNNLSYNFSGAAGFDTEINVTNSTVGTQAFYEPANQTIQIDSPGNELSFTGNSTTVTSFTVGYFVYGPRFNTDQMNILWGMLPTHEYSNQSRFLFIHRKGAVVARIYSNYGTITSLILSENPSKWSNWFHVTFTFEQSTRRIIGFIDGLPMGNTTLSYSWNAQGTSGGFAIPSFLKNIIF